MGPVAELLARLYEAWGERDIEGMLALYDPDIEFVTSGAFPGLSPVYRGHAGSRRFWDEFGAMWERLEIRAERFEEQDGLVVGLFRFEGTGRNGVPVVRQGGHVGRVRGGLFVELQAYSSWDEALADFEAAARQPS